MKKLITISVLALIITTVYGQEFNNLNSKIKKVSVFPDRAQVTREAPVNINQGKSLLRISGLSPFIDPSSIQVKGEGDFMIISVNNQLNYLEAIDESEEVKNLRSRIEELKIKIEDEKTNIEILREKEAFLTANRVISGKNENISAQELKSITDLYASSIESIRKSILEKNRLIVKYEQEKNKLENQLSGTVSRSKTMSTEVIISVSASRAVSANIILSYLVSNAGWYPSYDIRVDDINEDVKIFYKANVKQSTGRDWSNALISFSNASPSQSGDIPELFPYYLNFFAPVARDIYSSDKRSAEFQAMAKSTEPEEASEEGKEIRIRGVISPEVKIISAGTVFSFEVDMPQNVRSDGKINTIELQRISAAANYKYVSIPKLRKEAFLTADIHDWESLNLLNGEANIYFGNTFTGTTMLNTDQISDTLNVSLGIDNGISIEREKRKEYTSVRTIGTNRIDTRSFITTIRNNKSDPINIIVYDQVPISQNKDIEVETEEISGGILNEYTGEVQWKTTIPARESKEYILTYTVKYPKNKKVVLD
ncbi:MAG: mucoidy inhibitor MuiA family protein [Bacteroidales bacterium]|nr:mucoidy inhibitor MuiA family protein [Bacteroidales bacterium]